ncbi:tumorhead S homeolog [Xenopus laevis]|uniref:Tumorhead n=1 Tax=Xenopus laevis TaxID=8355 RepID=Q8JIU8_XENLA|nr:tumorhead S homeolog [Xenopus laevis]AAM28247.1 tumorhead [Xenopus laevis]
MVGILPGSTDTAATFSDNNSGKRRMNTSHQDLLIEKPIKCEHSPIPLDSDDLHRFAREDILKFEIEDISEHETDDTSELETDAHEDAFMTDGVHCPITSLPRIRKMRFSDDELNVLVQEVHDNVSQLFGELSVKTPTAVKNKIWEGIVAKVNAIGVTTRTVSEIKKRWHDLRRRTKMKLSVFEPFGHHLEAVSPVFQPPHHQRLLQETIHPHQIQGISDLDTSSAIFTSNAAITTTQDTEEYIDDTVEQEKQCTEVTETTMQQSTFPTFHREIRGDNQQFSDHFKASQITQQKLISEIRLLRNEMSQSAHGLQQSIDMHLSHIASSIDMHLGHIASSIEKHLGLIATNMLTLSHNRAPNSESLSGPSKDSRTPSGNPSVPKYPCCSSSETETCDVSDQINTQVPNATIQFTLDRGASQKISKVPVKRRAQSYDPSEFIDSRDIESEENGVFVQINEGHIHTANTARALRSRPSSSLEQATVKKKLAK